MQKSGWGWSFLLDGFGLESLEWVEFVYSRRVQVVGRGQMCLTEIRNACGNPKKFKRILIAFGSLADVL